MALHAPDREPAAHAAAPADLDHLPQPLWIGRLADDAGVEFLAAFLEPAQHRLGAVDRGPFLIAGDEKADRAVEPALALCQEARGGSGEGADGPLHVGGPAPDQLAIDDGRVIGIDAPMILVAVGHHVGMAGEAEIAAAFAETGVE